jgi:hypothetical protein
MGISPEFVVVQIERVHFKGLGFTGFCSGCSAIRRAGFHRVCGRCSVFQRAGLQRVL